MKKLLVVLSLLVVACSENTAPKSAVVPTTPTAAPGHAALLLKVSGDSQTATPGTALPNPIVVQVVDSNGKPVPGQIVNFVIVSGHGSVFAGVSLTNDSGVSRELWTLGTAADSQRLEARAVDNSTGAPLTFAVFSATVTVTNPTTPDTNTTTPTTPDTNSSPVRNSLIADLRALVPLQDAYKAKYGVYATSLASLTSFGTLPLAAGDFITMDLGPYPHGVGATPQEQGRGWAAESNNPAYPLTCGIAVGTNPSGQPNVPAALYGWPSYTPPTFSDSTASGVISGVGPDCK